MKQSTSGRVGDGDVTFVYEKSFEKGETALRSFDETPRVPDDLTSITSRVVTLTRIDHVG
jgi:hypothetical protein